MLDAVYIWISVAFMFLLGSIWGEHDVKFGIILVPLFSALFWAVGWLPNEYIQLAFSFAITLGAITFLKDQYRARVGTGAATHTIWPIMAFVIFVQFAMIFVCGMSYVFGDLGSGTMTVTNSTINNYNIVSAETVYGSLTTVDELDAVTTTLTLGWMAYNTVWTMFFSTIKMAPILINMFGVPPLVANVIQVGMYILIAVEVITLLVFRVRPPQV